MGDNKVTLDFHASQVSSSFHEERKGYSTESTHDDNQERRRAPDREQNKAEKRHAEIGWRVD